MSKFLSQSLIYPLLDAACSVLAARDGTALKGENAKPGKTEVLQYAHKQPLFRKKRHIVNVGIEEQDDEFILPLSWETVAQHVHQYFMSLLTSLPNGCEQLSLLEQLLAFSMFNKDDDVQSVNYLTTSCACMQCGLSSTQFHAAFLSSYKAVYNISSHHDLYKTEIRQELDFGKKGIEEKENAQIINNEDEELIDATDEEENIITQASDENDIVIPDIDLADLCNFDFGIHQSDISEEDFHDSSPKDV
ncbi:uncharacterized protein EV420DRAFT_1474666 [Desarmillaria tabescens]|uniref:Uncharacterized protein n=1 Tax=Armillaria tabescens TaxID=1929756 RepID=A0AA39NKI1_ARMTA|nr:uncharacterized protein EV420DRAFT_1474666 [Desarmillaria tabescens]KAK0467347.1 hypothetical protein EV420DRAFT_1474666 [Desarmillaria tabescens]